MRAGDRVHARVTRLTDQAAFVDLGGRTGIVPRADLPRTRSSPSQFMEVGETWEFAVIQDDSPSAPLLLAGPIFGAINLWEGVAARYPVGSRVVAVVRNFVTNGVYVELDEGIDALLSAQELEASEKKLRARDKVLVVVTSVDEALRKISVSLA